MNVAFHFWFCPGRLKSAQSSVILEWMLVFKELISPLPHEPCHKREGEVMKPWSKRNGGRLHLHGRTLDREVRNNIKWRAVIQAGILPAPSNWYPVLFNSWKNSRTFSTRHNSHRKWEEEGCYPWGKWAAYQLCSTSKLISYWEWGLHIQQDFFFRLCSRDWWHTIICGVEIKYIWTRVTPDTRSIQGIWSVSWDIKWKHFLGK